MKIKLDEGALMPVRAHASDAGLDLLTPCDFTLYGFESIVIDTGVHVELPPGTVGFLKSKSGLNVYHDIIGEGVIDEGYTGSIRVKLYNMDGEEYAFRRGDKLIQLVILPVCKPPIVLVDGLGESERGENGFGSSGR